ncbi:MAG: MerR family transcriptional regulator [Spirochaetes bacterium]|jgi:DNA-binding transcriptional MerR regulator|nr:MerR family transcriptional regulator [Spirochaetota bacterium]
MSRFLIGQVCNALGVRAHVLRYWERHVELLSPAKDRSGRRMYTLRDVQLLSRLKYLVYSRGMSVEGASRKLVEEVQGDGQNRKAAFDSLRGDLFRVSLGAQRLGERLESLHAEQTGTLGETPAADELRQIVQEAWRASLEGRGEPPHGSSREKGGIRRAERQAAPRRNPADLTDTAPRGREDFAGAWSLLRRAPVLVVSPAPPAGSTVERYPGLLPLLGLGGETVLDRIGRQLSGLAREFGHEPLWLIGASHPVVPAVRRHVAMRGFYGLCADRIKVLREPRVPYLRADGQPLRTAEGSGPSYELPLLSALRNAARHVEGRDGVPAPSRRLETSKPSDPSVRFALTLLVPVTNALPWIPDLEFVSRHLDVGAEVSMKASRVSGAEGPAKPTGEAVLSTGMCTVVPREIPREVRRFRGEDDTLERGASRARFGMEQLLQAAGTGLVFEVDARAELALLRSPADWDTCSRQVRERA